MMMHWVPCSDSLPRDGDAIRFLLDSRDASIDGTYARGAFRSRWNEYDVGRVRSWRTLDDIEAAADPAWRAGAGSAQPRPSIARRSIAGDEA